MLAGDTCDGARRGTPRDVAREITFRAFFSRQNSRILFRVTLVGHL